MHIQCPTQHSIHVHIAFTIYPDPRTQMQLHGVLASRIGTSRLVFLYSSLFIVSVDKRRFLCRSCSTRCLRLCERCVNGRKCVRVKSPLKPEDTLPLNAFFLQFLTHSSQRLTVHSASHTQTSACPARRQCPCTFALACTYIFVYESH